MCHLAELEAYLSLDHHPDAWSDGDYQHAALLCDAIDDTAWEELRRLWRQRAIRWQALLADALCASSKSSRSLALAEEMLESDDERVLENVVGTLESRDDIYVPSELARPRLRELQARWVGHYLSDQVRTLLARAGRSSNRVDGTSDPMSERAARPDVRTGSSSARK